MNWAEFFNNLDDYNEAFMNSGNLKKPEPEDAPPDLDKVAEWSSKGRKPLYDFENMNNPEEAPPDLVIRVPANILTGNCSLATFSAYVASLSEEDCKNLHLLDYMRLMKLIKEMNFYKTEPLPEDNK